jgi:xylan 1,4-beta-xylosidase
MNHPLRLAVLAAALTSAFAAAGEARFERFTYSGKSQESAAPAPGEYRNPILSGYYPDPSIVRVGDDYYLVNSTFTNFPGIPVFHSKNLVDWTQIGNVISRPGQFDFKGLTSSRGIYAPDISFNKGVFYLVTTCADCAGNVVMTATNPAGPWSDPNRLSFQGIDPSIFWDSDGKAYIVNNDAPAEKPRYDGHRAIWIQEFDPKAMKMVGERTLLVNGGVDLSKKPIWIEGPHIIKRGQWYYMIAAEGGTGDQHSQVVLRSASLRGPYVPFEGNPILTQRDLPKDRAHPVTSAGHAKFVETQNGEWWAVFLATRPYAGDMYNIGRETFMLPVSWQDGWPRILGQGKAIPFTAAKPKLPAQPTGKTSGDIAYVDEFERETLSYEWIGVRTPHAPFYRIGQGALHLSSAGRLGDVQATPAFIGRRQQHHIADVSTTVSFGPAPDGERAGLVAYQSDESFLFFGLTHIGGKKMVALYTRKKAAQDTLVASAPVGDAPVTLALRADGGKMQFDYTVDGRTQRLAGDVDTTFLSTQKAGGFTGTVIGLYTGK